MTGGLVAGEARRPRFRRGPGRRVALLGALGIAALTLTTTGAAHAAPAPAAAVHPALSAPSGGTVPLDQTPPPNSVAVDAADHTAYVIQGDQNLAQLSLIDTTTCGSVNATGCAKAPADNITLGNDSDAQATSVAYDAADHTLIVTSSDAVAFVKTATCDVAVPTCTSVTTIAAPTTGSAFDASVVDPTTDTVYVADAGNGAVLALSGANPAAKINVAAVGDVPDALAVDPTTSTLYVTNNADSTVSLIDTATCNDAAATGCPTTTPAPTVTTDPGPDGVAVGSAADGTAYVATSNGTVSLIPTATCNATTASGCVGGSTPITVNAGDYLSAAAYDSTTNTIDVTDSTDNTLKTFPAGTCKAGSTTCTAGSIGAGTGPVAVTVDNSFAPASTYVVDAGTPAVTLLDGPRPLYREVTGTGQVATFTTTGAAPVISAPIPGLVKPIVGMAQTPSGDGYWLVAADGGVFNYGDAAFYGSAGNLKLTKPVVGMTALANGKGYYLVAADGGVFNYNAPFDGSAGALKLTKPVVGITASPTGGYWLVAGDGGVFNYGAPFYGSAGALKLTKPVVGIDTTSDGKGYWLDAADGGVFNYGDAPFNGSAGALKLVAPVVSTISGTPDNKGYWLFAADGGVFNYGDATFAGAVPPVSGPIVDGQAVPAATA